MSVTTEMLALRALVLALQAENERLRSEASQCIALSSDGATLRCSVDLLFFNHIQPHDRFTIDHSETRNFGRHEKCLSFIWCSTMALVDFRKALDGSNDCSISIYQTLLYSSDELGQWCDVATAVRIVDQLNKAVKQFADRDGRDFNTLVVEFARFAEMARDFFET